jgi:hypothetical protein
MRLSRIQCIHGQTCRGPQGDTALPDDENGRTAREIQNFC